MADFDLVRLPPDIEKGAMIGPAFNTTILSLMGGGEQRNQRWAQELLRANIAFGMMGRGDGSVYSEGVIRRKFEDIQSFFRARRGRARGFLFKDWTDYTANGEFIGTGNGANSTFQLVKVYGSGDDAYIRKITRPIVSTVSVTVDGVVRPVTHGALGLVTINAFDYDGDPETPAGAPPNGAEIRWSGEFDVPVRFDSDVQQVELATALAGAIPNIDIVGLFE